MAPREERLRQALRQPRTLKQLEEEIGFEPCYHLHKLIRRGEALRSAELVEVEAKSGAKRKVPLYVSSEATSDGWAYWQGKPIQFIQRLPKAKYLRAEKVLRAIEEHGPITSKELSERLGVTTHILSGQLRSLYVKG